MKKLFLIFCFGFLLTFPLRTSAMMEPSKIAKGATDERFSEKTTLDFSKEQEENALIEERKNQASSAVTTTEVIATTTTEVIATTKAANDSDINAETVLRPSFYEPTLDNLEKSQEEKELRDARAFEQKIEEADETLTALLISTNLEEKELDPIYDYWKREFNKYEKVFRNSLETKGISEEAEDKLSEVIEKCSDVIEVVRQRLEVLHSHKTSRLNLKELPFQQSVFPTKLPLASKSSSATSDEEVASFLFKREESSNLKITYHLNMLMQEIEKMPSDEAKIKEYKTIQNALKKQTIKISSDREKGQQQAQAKEFFNKARRLHEDASKIVESVTQKGLFEGYLYVQELYEKGLGKAYEALSYAQQATELYRSPAWSKNAKELSERLREKINLWHITKCQTVQQLAQKEKQEAERQRDLEDNKESNEIANTWDSIASKFKVLSNHFSKAREAYEKGNLIEAKESERKAAVIQERINGLNKDLQSLKQQQTKWENNFQTEESRCLETQETPQLDGTKMVRKIYKPRFTGPLLLQEFITDSNNTILRKKEMEAECLMVELQQGESKEAFLANLQQYISNSNINWEIKEVLPQYHLYTLYFRVPEGESKLELLDRVEAAIKENQLASCRRNEVIELASSQVPEKGPSKIELDGELQEPWALSPAPFGINPPANLYDGTAPAVQKPKEPIRVAVLDTGIRSTHQAFIAKIHLREDEYGEEFFGYDPNEKNETEQGRPRDNSGHGSHVAGIIAASPYLVKEVEKKTNANTFKTVSISEAIIRGIASIEGMVELIVCKNILPGTSKGFIDRTLQCIDYARGQGAQIMNCSWGGSQDSEEMTGENLQKLKQALSNDYILSSGEKAPSMVVVTAAGNLREEQAQRLLERAKKGELSSIQPLSQPPTTQQEFNNLILEKISEGEDPRNKDVYHSYPAGLPLPNAIAVGATKKDGKLTPISYYGKQAIQITAPGTAIISASHTGDRAYRMLTGSSMSTPHATAAFVFMRVKFPNLSSEKLVEHLSGQADNKQPPQIKVAFGRLHLANALQQPESEKTELKLIEEEEKNFKKSDQKFFPKK